jgi:protein-tyrosine-phosphatase
MAEGMMKKFYGHRAYVQSAGVKGEMEVDGFTVAVCDEMGVPLHRHRVRSFEEMQEWGDDLSQFDLIVALSPRKPAAGAGIHPLPPPRRRILADPRPHRPWRDARGEARRLPPDPRPDPRAHDRPLRPADRAAGRGGLTGGPVKIPRRKPADSRLNYARFETI